MRIRQIRKRTRKQEIRITRGRDCLVGCALIKDGFDQTRVGTPIVDQRVGASLEKNGAVPHVSRGNQTKTAPPIRVYSCLFESVRVHSRLFEFVRAPHFQQTDGGPENAHNTQA
jgi:hypothetical protein